MGAKHGINGSLRLSRRRYQPVLAVLLLPSMLLIGVFSYYPAVRSLIGGFYQWNGFTPPTYAGISQFKQYVQSPTFGIEAKNIAVLVGILITLVAQFTAAEVVTHMPRRAALGIDQAPGTAGFARPLLGPHRGQALTSASGSGDRTQHQGGRRAGRRVGRHRLQGAQ